MPATKRPLNLTQIRRLALPIAREADDGSPTSRPALACLVLKLTDELQRKHDALFYAATLLPRRVDAHRIDCALARTTVGD